MTQSFVFLLLLTTISLLLFQSVNCRTISYEVNLNCSETLTKDWCEDNHLVHIWSTNDNNTIHYLWSSITGIPPSLLIIKTEPKSELTIDWKKISGEDTDIKRGIDFSIPPSNAIGLQFSQLFFFNVNKTGAYNKGDETIDLDWNHLTWKAMKAPKEQKDLNSIEIEFPLDIANSSVAFKLRVESSDKRDDDLPHLQFTDTSASIALLVQDFNATFGDPNQPRLMADVLLMKYGSESNKSTSFDSSKSIDDEYTPGVFKRIYLNLNSKKDSKSGEKDSKTFIQFKPIAYNSGERLIANTLDVISSDVRVDTQNPLPVYNYNSTLLEAFFETREHTKHIFNYTFGGPEDDKYYSDNSYVQFSLVVGLGAAPEDSLSFLVQMIIVVGFGLPLLVTVISALYLLVRKIRSRNYNDLLLSQS